MVEVARIDNCCALTWGKLFDKVVYQLEAAGIPGVATHRPRDAPGGVFYRGVDQTVLGNDRIDGFVVGLRDDRNQIVQSYLSIVIVSIP